MTDFSKTISFIDSIILNDVQRSAVLYNEGPQLVFAGAGTGKTRVLTAKIAFLIKEIGLFPNNIFAATFTNKAASEMRSRVEEMIGISCTGLWIGTFHSLCARILRRDAHHLGFTATFTIYDQQDQLSLIKKVMKEMGLEERTMQPKQVLRIISNYKNACIPWEELEDTGKSYYERELIQVYKQYQQALGHAQAMDFDDLITNTVYLFRKNVQVLERYRKQFHYVLVDEYQDTNKSQFYLVQLLARNHHRIFVVGDDDQSIYSWRGAQIENILTFDTVFPGTKVFKLEQNYRSTQAILDFANAVISNISNRAAKRLWTSRRSTSEVVVTRYRDDRQEADGVAEKISEYITKGITPGSMAILFRTNAQSRAFEDVLRKRNIQYVIVGGISFYERKEVKDCLAYLRLLVNPDDTISCERILNVPARGIGTKTQEKLALMALEKGVSLFKLVVSREYDAVGARASKGLEEFATIFSLLLELSENKTPPQDILSEMLSVTGYVDLLDAEDTGESRARLENINELLNALTIWHEENEGRTLSDFLEEISLATDIDGWKHEKDAVNLMTLHCAKGLEFEVVFLVGLEDGLIPSRQNFEDDCMLEEECRLFYVGSTRAMNTLTCSYADTRMRFGSIMPMEPSRFIEQVPPQLFRFVDRSMLFSQTVRPYTERRKKRVVVTKKQERPARPVYDDFNQDTVQYRMGQVVAHSKYGQGKILAISGFGPDMRLTVLFNDGSRKRLMAKFANLQPV